MGVNVATGDGHCFNDGCDFAKRKTAIIKLRQTLNLGEWVVNEPVTTKHKRPVRLPKDFEVVSAGDDDYWGKKAYKYLTHRGVWLSQIKRYQIGYSVTDRDFAGRIVVPIYYKKKLRGLVTRALKDSVKPKYKNSVGDKALFGLPDVERKNRVVCVEGVFDQLAVSRGVCDYFDCVAWLGHSLTGRQIDMLRGYKEFILWPDPDHAGIEGFLDMVQFLAPLGKVSFVMPHRGDYRDPDELGVKSIKQRIKKRRPYTPELALRLKAWLAYEEN